MARTAAPALFHYLPNDSPVHAMDPRLKVGCLACLGVAAALASTWWQFALLLAATAGAFALASIPSGALLARSAPFAVLVAVVFATKLFVTPGTPLPVAGALGATVEGALDGGAFALRMLLVLALCTLMMATTTLLSLKQAIEWLLRSVPFVAEARVATAVELTFTMLPLLFDSYREIADAQAARCAQVRRNPLPRMLGLLRTLLETTLRRADDSVYAMESRCYSDVRTAPAFATAAFDKIAFLTAATLLAACCLS